MSDEIKQVEVLLGPYSGQRLNMPAADADQAVSDGWARDPFAPPVEPAKGAEPKPPPTDEERAATLAKADKALRKLRGETDETRDMTAARPNAGYTTRATTRP